MTKTVLPIGIIFLLFTGCFPEQKKIEVISAKPSGYEIQLVTEERELETERAYMDAFIAFKNQYQEQPLEFFKSSSSLYSIEDKITQLPTLLIRKEGKTIAKISGERNSKEIVDQLKNTIK